MEILDRAATAKSVVDLVSTARSLKVAVAFWGVGAARLFDRCNTSDVLIICNLESGACNPHEIALLMTKFPGRVMSHAALHGKLWLTDDEVILGSSNASANGLALEGGEVAGWHEANVRLTDFQALASSTVWFENLAMSSPCKIVSETLLEEARELWALRRSHVPRQPSAVLVESESEPSPGDGTFWRSDVVAALGDLGGEATLHAIYTEVRRRRLHFGRSTPPSLEAIIRKELEYNCPESDVFQGRPLFAMPRGKWAGVWALRQDS